jgi:hypothetical protein
MVEFRNKLSKPIKVMWRTAILRKYLAIKPRENCYRIRLGHPHSFPYHNHFSIEGTLWYLHRYCCLVSERLKPS